MAMNETTVTFGQVMMVLQFLLAARIMRYATAMKLALVQVPAFWTGGLKGAGFGKNLSGMQKPVKGEKR